MGHQSSLAGGPVFGVHYTPGSLAHAQRICKYADRLYQLGRGIDQAWAVGEITEPQKLEVLLLTYRGVVHQPTGGRHGTVLARPQQGSLKSLKDRYETMSQRFTAQGQGRSVKLQFAQAPKPRFTPTAYNSPPNRQVFELRSRTTQADLFAWPLSRISNLVVAIRDGAVAKLKMALPDQEPQIEKCLVGRKADGRDEAPKAARVRILPLPSIGHVHADHAIRRVLVEVPAGCLVRSDDVFWAFSGLELTGADSASRPDSMLTATSDNAMLRHYGLDGQEYARWRTITPAALPEIAKRRRIEPTRRTAEAKRGVERATEQQRAAVSVIQALRHAEVRVQIDSIRVQREPFDANGERVEAFAPGTRFQKERLWHVEVIFKEPVSGPLLIGDGRYYALGLMKPVTDW
ncbi:MAG: type I-U CRISPR-associated protein Cas5/Cas6 [Planctomycetes bacterium]|nr:type I-U CRISPR-associated protein Cas5/Cas6 [Planctomycetota bacterium]